MRRIYYEGATKGGKTKEKKGSEAEVYNKCKAK